MNYTNLFNKNQMSDRGKGVLCLKKDEFSKRKDKRLHIIRLYSF